MPTQELIIHELREIRVELKEIRTLLEGDVDTPGIRTRVALLEQSQRRRTIPFRSIIVTLLGAIGGIVQFFRHKNGN